MVSYLANMLGEVERGGPVDGGPSANTGSCQNLSTKCQQHNDMITQTHPKGLCQSVSQTDRQK
jgi:hypothetical protein